MVSSHELASILSFVFVPILNESQINPMSLTLSNTIFVASLLVLASNLKWDFVIVSAILFTICVKQPNFGVQLYIQITTYNTLKNVNHAIFKLF